MYQFNTQYNNNGLRIPEATTVIRIVGSNMTIKQALGFVLFSLLTVKVYATPGYSGLLEVDRFWIDGSGVYVGFKVMPVDCTGNFAVSHAYIDKNIENFNQIFSVLLASSMSGKKVDIWYDDRGDCTTPDTVLNIYALGIGAGQN
ncbi:MAG: hypothetical protein ACI8SR_002949 [Oceanicoccus sp.]|jgi:hypothetical protein